MLNPAPVTSFYWNIWLEEGPFEMHLTKYIKQDTTKREKKNNSNSDSDSDKK